MTQVWLTAVEADFPSEQMKKLKLKQVETETPFDTGGAGGA